MKKPQPREGRIRVVRGGNHGQLKYVVILLRRYRRFDDRIVIRRWLASSKRWAKSKRTILSSDILGCPVITPRLRRTIDAAINALADAPPLTNNEINNA